MKLHPFVLPVALTTVLVGGSAFALGTAKHRTVVPSPSPTISVTPSPVMSDQGIIDVPATEIPTAAPTSSPSPKGFRRSSVSNPTPTPTAITSSAPATPTPVATPVSPTPKPVKPIYTISPVCCIKLPPLVATPTPTPAPWWKDIIKL